MAISPPPTSRTIRCAGAPFGITHVDGVDSANLDFDAGRNREQRIQHLDSGGKSHPRVRPTIEGIGLSLAVWRIHRRIGMSGGLLAQALGREIDGSLSEDQIETLQRLHAAAFERHAHLLRPLPGASALLPRLSDRGAQQYAIATSGRLKNAKPALDALSLPPDATVITRDEVLRAKPDPDLFLLAANRLGPFGPARPPGRSRSPGTQLASRPTPEPDAPLRSVWYLRDPVPP